MNADDSAINQAEPAPVMPAPMPPQGKVSMVEYIRLLRDSSIAAFGQEAYELDIIERRILGRPRFIVNDPAAVKHVLLDNVANYEKTEIMRRILEPGLGKGLLTSEGETWKVHRRTMTPAFDQLLTLDEYYDLVGLKGQLEREESYDKAAAALVHKRAAE